MAAKFMTYENLNALIKHHIALIERFETHSNEELALLFLELKECEKKDIQNEIIDLFRDTDIILTHNDNYIFLLPKTDWNGAFNLLKGLQDFLGQELKESIVTYPDDGKNAEELLQSFDKAIEKCS